VKPVLLGTAQWGLDYGITNARGLLADEALHDIVSEARSWGIEALDTSPAYGTAESRIPQFASGFRIQTKCLTANNSKRTPTESFWHSVSACAARPECLLIHDWSSASPSERANAVKEIEDLRDSGEVLAVGVSAYSEADIEDALSMFRTLDVVQVPTSILDQRLVGSSVIGSARSGSTRIQARSIFLQGVLLSEDNHFSSHPDVLRFNKRAAEIGMSQLKLALAYLAAQEWVDEVTFGVTSSSELNAIMRTMTDSLGGADISALASSDDSLLDPRSW
jgi:aryl-alcohol dehydrogenase-like predicted oxidoreductase